MESEATGNLNHVASESAAPLISPIASGSDQDLFIVPLKRPSPRLPPSRYRNVKPRSPPRSPTGAAGVLSPTRQQSSLARSPHNGIPFQSPPISDHTLKPETPPMYASPLMSPDSALGRHYRSIIGSPNGHSMTAPGSLSYNSPPMSGRGTRADSSWIMSPETGSARGSPRPESFRSRENTTTAASRTSGDKTSPPTRATSVDDSPPPPVTHGKFSNDITKPADQPDQTRPPEIPPLSIARALRSNRGSPSLSNNHNPVAHHHHQPPASQPANLGLALNFEITDPDQLAPSFDFDERSPPAPPFYHPVQPHEPDHEPQDAAAHTAPGAGAVPDSPRERLSQLRATPDSAYDRARQMEARRSEWKRAVYRFPVRGGDDWVVGADLTESSHARLADVARRSADGFARNGGARDRDLAAVYRVLAAAHARIVEEMREERKAAAAARARARTRM